MSERHKKGPFCGCKSRDSYNKVQINFLVFLTRSFLVESLEFRVSGEFFSLELRV